MGRRSGPNPEVISHLEKLIGAGLPQATAARLARVPEATLRLWLREAKSGRGGTYQDLLSAITRARAQAEAGAIARIRSSDDWRAASWWLAHHPETRDRWGDAAAIRRAEQAQLALIVGVIEQEIADPDLRLKLFMAMQAAGVGQIPSDGDAADAET